MITLTYVGSFKKIIFKNERGSMENTSGQDMNSELKVINKNGMYLPLCMYIYSKQIDASVSRSVC